MHHLKDKKAYLCSNRLQNYRYLKLVTMTETIKDYVVTTFKVWMHETEQFSRDNLLLLCLLETKRGGRFLDYEKYVEVLISLFFIMALSFISMSLSKNILLVLSAFCILEVVFILVSTSLKVTINSKINSQSRASVLNALSMFVRIGSISVLGIAKIFLTNKSNVHEASNQLYHFSALTIILTLASYLAYGKLIKINQTAVGIKA